MTKFSVALLISAGTSAFWGLLSLLLHLPGICTGMVAIISFIGVFVGISVCMVAKN